jgi:hypothetical protein
MEEDMTAWALNLPAGELFVALEVLLAFRTGEFKVAHKGMDFSLWNTNAKVSFLQWGDFSLLEVDLLRRARHNPAILALEILAAKSIEA